MPEGQVRERRRAVVAYTVNNASSALNLHVADNRVVLLEGNGVLYEIASFFGLGQSRRFFREEKVEIASDVLAGCEREGYGCSRLAKVRLSLGYVPRRIGLTKP